MDQSHSSKLNPTCYLGGTQMRIPGSTRGREREQAAAADPKRANGRGSRLRRRRRTRARSLAQTDCLPPPSPPPPPPRHSLAFHPSSDPESDNPQSVDSSLPHCSSLFSLSAAAEMVITTDKDKLTRPLNFILKKARTPSADGRKQVRRGRLIGWSPLYRAFRVSFLMLFHG